MPSQVESRASEEAARQKASLRLQRRQKKATPVMRQYLEIKEGCPDAILFFQMGDFYEMFYEDANLAAKVLDLTLTSRQSDGEGPIPMCGMPCRAGTAYCSRLLDAGHKVAICDQVEAVSAAKKVVKRQVVRTLTPGTVIDPNFLDSKEACYLAALTAHRKETAWGLSWVDVSTGEFSGCEIAGDQAVVLLRGELERIRPRELLVCASEALPVEVSSLAADWGIRIEVRGAEEFSSPRPAERLEEQFPEENFSVFLEDYPLAVEAASALLEYLRENQPGELPHLRPVCIHRLSDAMRLDAATQRNLELVQTAYEGAVRGSLFGLLDKTLTGMGGRLLKKWVLAPLLSCDQIALRADAVEELVAKLPEREALRDALQRVQDIERILGRIGLQSANARDLAGLAVSLRTLPGILAQLKALAAERFQALAAGWDSLEDIATLLEDALVDEPPPTIREGGIFRDDFDPRLRELRAATRDGKKWLSSYETRERERADFPLKIGYNRVFGYYLEVSKRFSEKVPEDFVRKQTLVSAERYITSELKEIEEKVTGAEEKAKALEYLLFGQLRTQIGGASKRILAAADRLAYLDTIASLAEVAVSHQYVRPEVDEGEEIEIIEGRHPIMDADPALSTFVPNDLRIGGAAQILIVTGPNMSGKSTFLRQSALIILMAQMGGFVPAHSARIGLVDRVFTRVGAHDRLLEGQSTFMVEMVETATILREATSRSFVVLDEVGRGTSTYDGVSIAWAVVEYLHEAEGHRARTLFATHYHELAEIAKNFPRVGNLTVEVRESGDDVVFLRKVVAGSSNRSYGIHVGRLAGLPPEVLARARELLGELEGAGFRLREAAATERGGARKAPSPGPQLSLFAAAPPPLVEALKEVNPDRLSPREALEKLYELKGILDTGP